MVLKYQDILPTHPAPGITRRILAHGGQMMGVEASFEKGAVGEAHRHPHEQVSYILSGSFQYEVEGKPIPCTRATATMWPPMSSTELPLWRMP